MQLLPGATIEMIFVAASIVALAIASFRTYMEEKRSSNKVSCETEIESFDQANAA